MEKRRLGKTGLDVSVLGFGGSEIGFEKAEQSTVDQLLNSALDAGLNLIDTAAIYPLSEAKIGAAVGSRRGDFVLITKCGSPMSNDDQYWNAKALTASIDKSLADLQTDHVDVVQLHSCSAEILARGEAIAALQRAREAGKTRYIGYSGDNANAIYAVDTGVFDTLQTSINIADQSILNGALPRALAAGMGVIAKRPIANAAWKTGAKPVSSYHHEYWDRLQKLKYDFLAADLEESIGIALRFTLGQPGVTTAIVGTTKPDRWKANARHVAAQPSDGEIFNRIRARWQEVAGPDWVGQT